MSGKSETVSLRAAAQIAERLQRGACSDVDAATFCVAAGIFLAHLRSFDDDAPVCISGAVEALRFGFRAGLRASASPECVSLDGKAGHA
jgi:hypothetical protein